MNTLIQSKLKAIDTLLLESNIQVASLNPNQLTITPFEAQTHKIQGLKFATQEEITHQLLNIIKAEIKNFPQNIFWDFDYLIANFIKTKDTLIIKEMGEKITFLFAQFGEDSPIRFRYVHDFMYGFDWAKWVKTNPTKHSTILPFDLKFLDYTIQRGLELKELIAKDDPKYYKLKTATHRNPFAFSREPKSEILLLKNLVKKDYIPVKTWAMDNQPIWDKPYAIFRKKLSKSLGIQKNKSNV